VTLISPRSQIHPDPLRSTQIHPDPSRSIQIHPDPPRSSRSVQICLQAPSRSTEIHLIQMGFVQTTTRGGTPEGSRGPSGSALGQPVARWCHLLSFWVTFLNTFWHPWCQGGHPGRCPGQLWGRLVIFGHLFGSLLAPLGSRWPPGRTRGLPLGTFRSTFVSPRVQKRYQMMSKARICGFYENVCFLMVKRYILRAWATRGAPNGHFLVPFWHPLGHLGAPEPPLDAQWAPLGHNCGPTRVFVAFWLPKGTPANP